MTPKVFHLLTSHEGARGNINLMSIPPQGCTTCQYLGEGNGTATEVFHLSATHEGSSLAREGKHHCLIFVPVVAVWALKASTKASMPKGIMRIR